MDERRLDVGVVGAGPAGLAVAIEAARRGLSVGVFEQSAELVDKACGEGIMPPGVRALDALGVRARISSADCRPFRKIRYVDADGAFAEGKLPGEALAVRRIALVRAMAERARELGADLRFGCGVASHRRSERGVLLETNEGPVVATVLVAADGLASRLRAAEGLDLPRRGARRFGLRRHFDCAPWSGAVEVHLARGAEAYVTPVSDRCTGVAFLWSEPAAPPPADSGTETRWHRLVERFPALAARLEGVNALSRLRGAGPLERAARARTADRFALVGDAAGYVDAITGEGISLSLLSALALGRVLPDVVAQDGRRAALAPYERDFDRLFRSYAMFTRAVLALARAERVRRAALVLLRRFPRLFDAILALGIGS